MNALVTQLCDACRTFSARKGMPEWGMAGFVLFYSGGALAANVPRGGIPTLEHAQDWLDSLVNERLFNEKFVARGLARRIEDEFEGMLENYAVSLRRRRQILDMAVSKGLIPDDQLEEAQRLAVGSLDEMKLRREDLVLWREVAEPLLR